MMPKGIARQPTGDERLGAEDGRLCGVRPALWGLARPRHDGGASGGMHGEGLRRPPPRGARCSQKEKETHVAQETASFEGKSVLHRGRLAEDKLSPAAAENYFEPDAEMVYGSAQIKSLVLCGEGIRDG